MLNKTMLIGNLGDDVDNRCTKNLVAVSTFRLATTERWTDAQGNRQESTEWHRIVTFGRLAEICDQYLKKGSRVYIEGPIRTRRWQDDQGVTRYTTEIIGREMKMLGGADSSERIPDPPAESEPPPMTDDVPF